jgi:hypothetical protein
VDGQEGVVKPGFVQCIAQHHPDRKDGKKPMDPFLVPCPQGLQNFEDHLRTHHGVVGRKDTQPTIAAAFLGEGQAKKARHASTAAIPVKIGTRREATSL